MINNNLKGMARFKIILTKIIIFGIVIVLVNHYLFDFWGFLSSFIEGFPSCKYKSIFVKGENGAKYPLQNPYNLSTIISAFNNNTNYTGHVRFFDDMSMDYVKKDLRDIATVKKVSLWQQDTYKIFWVHIERRFNGIIYRIDFWKEVDGLLFDVSTEDPSYSLVGGGEPCYKPDGIIERHINEMIEDMNLSSYQENELKSVIRVSQFGSGFL